MKRLTAWLLSLMLLLAAIPALADDTAAVIAILQKAHPQMTLHDLRTWGGTAAAVLAENGVNILCVLEKTGGQWALVVDNPRALLQDLECPQLLLDTDDALFWSYLMYGGTHKTTFSSYRKRGEWGSVGEIVQSGDGHEVIVWWDDVSGVGTIVTQEEFRDENDNLLSTSYERRIPVPWLSDCVKLKDFDIARFPYFEFEEYDGEWPARAFIAEAAANLMPNYTFVSGAFAGGHYRFLMTNPRGARVFVGCNFDGGFSLVESAPLPMGTTYGYENFTNSLDIRGNCVSIEPSDDGKWRVSEVDFGVSALMGKRCIIDRDRNTLYYGTHGWDDITKVDWEALSSISEIVKGVNGKGWALVENPNSADRLHLRDKPDQGGKSLGKYYNGTPVEIIGIQGDWANVRIGGVKGYMMKKFLDFNQPLTGSLDAMPSIYMKDASSTMLYPRAEKADGRELPYYDDIRVIGLVDTAWYHVWFPTTDEYGYVLQDQWVTQ